MILAKRIPLEREPQEGQNGANFNSSGEYECVKKFDPTLFYSHVLYVLGLVVMSHLSP